MSDARGWGGRIIANKASAKWSISNRYYDTSRDQEGIMEYVIRPITAQSKKNMIRSKDGKCQIIVKSEGWGEDDRNAVFLIVSGYGVPPSMLGSDPVTNLRDFTLGKDYFITADRYNPDSQCSVLEEDSDDQPDVPVYDVILFYDDYDLNRVGIQSSITADQLSLCYLDLKETRIIPIDATQANIKRSEEIAGEQDIFVEFSWRRAERLVRDGIPVTVERLPNMRALIARNVQVPATFSLMYHAQIAGEDHHEDH